MKVLVLGNDRMRKEWGESHNVLWSERLVADAIDLEGGVCIDMLFDNSAERIRELNSLNAAVVVVNFVAGTLTGLGPNFVRMNGWPGFIAGNVVEVAGSEMNRQLTEEALALAGKNVEWVGDIVGFLSPRVVCSIINEAYFTLGEGVSTKAEIDVAMKLGTNYPYGPFEWGSLIGLMNIHNLLDRLAVEHDRYRPASLLTNEAISNAGIS